MPSRSVVAIARCVAPKLRARSARSSPVRAGPRGLTSYLDSFLNALCVERGVAEHHLVGVPVGRRLSDLATFGEEHFATRAYFALDTLQDADAASGIVAVAAEMNLAGIRTDDGDAPVFCAIKRQKTVLVFEKNERLVCGLEGQLLMLGAVSNLLGYRDRRRGRRRARLGTS